MGEKSRVTHGASFLSAVSGAPWDDVAPLARVLEITLTPESATITPAHSGALWQKLSYLGSNDLAYLLRGFEGVDYPEIVRDVCKHLKLTAHRPGEEERVVEHNEQLVLAKLFADAWDQLDTDQRRELLRELNLDEGNLPLAGADVATAVLGGKGGPFAVYKLSRLVANSVARALPARRLAAARRKTVQAVVLVASLRQAQRTALAETALVGAEGPGPGMEPSADRPRRALHPASEKAAPRAATQAPAKKKKKKKVDRAASRTPERAARASRSQAVEQAGPAKQTAAKKPAKKKRATKKRPDKKQAAQKKEATKKKAKKKPQP